ncbi:hypothetical protein H8959_016962 [Pygathrix nigripes]
MGNDPEGGPRDELEKADKVSAVQGASTISTEAALGHRWRMQEGGPVRSAPCRPGTLHGSRQGSRGIGNGHPPRRV